MGIAIAISHKGAMQRGAAQFTAAWEDVLYWMDSYNLST